MIDVFMVYSHKDEALRDELEGHLSLVKRQQIINVWHDRRIGAGKNIDASIDKEFENCQIILLLVSSYFLESDYCFNIEMARALEKHEEGSACVIPIILRPSDWKSGPFGRLNALPKDGKPVTKYADQHEAFLEIVEGVRKVATELAGKGLPSAPVVAEPTVMTPKESITPARSSNLRTKKTFSDRDKDKFYKDGYEYIGNFFEASLSELKNRNGDVEFEFTPIDSMRFSAVIYRNGKAQSHCTVRLDRANWQGITFLPGEDRGSGSSFTHMLVVGDDGYSLFFRSGFGGSHEKDEHLTFQGAAELLWALFIEPLQR